MPRPRCGAACELLDRAVLGAGERQVASRAELLCGPTVRRMKWVTITPDWAAFPSLRRCVGRLVIQAVKTTPSEADMQTTISGQDGTHLPIAEALWILAGIILLIV